MDGSVRCAQPDCNEVIAFSTSGRTAIAARPAPALQTEVEVFLQCARGHVNKYIVRKS